MTCDCEDHDEYWNLKYGNRHPPDVDKKKNSFQYSNQSSLHSAENMGVFYRANA